ncbi:MAG: hypothetical protein U0Y68_19995 [Blastocatellia bacterium]
MKLTGNMNGFLRQFRHRIAANARIRFAWLKLNWEHASITMGQDWQLTAPLLPVPNQQSDMFFMSAMSEIAARSSKPNGSRKAGAGTLYLQGGIG